LNALVTGQDTVAGVVYRGKVYWIWGDTIGPTRWNFGVAGATSELPGKGGLDPSVGIDYTYFVDNHGFSRPMLPLRREGVVWIEGLFTLAGEQGREWLLATYTRQKGLSHAEERGVALFNDDREIFEPLVKLPWLEAHRSSHPYRATVNGRPYVYFYPELRVPDDWTAVRDPSRWERRPVPALEGKARLSSVAWNEHRRKWIMFAENTGQVLYGESDSPEGPWRKLVKIVDHDDYNFYNVAHHPFLNQQGGRIVYFEGTYTDTFSPAKSKTPRYNYNQVMYRLDLDDPRLLEAR
jgi:hypothetical protein